jgi:hypothetical protein
LSHYFSSQRGGRSLTGLSDFIYEGAESVKPFCNDGKKNLGINVFVSMDNKISESDHIGIFFKGLNYVQPFQLSEIFYG